MSNITEFKATVQNLITCCEKLLNLSLNNEQRLQLKRINIYKNIINLIDEKREDDAIRYFNANYEFLSNEQQNDADVPSYGGVQIILMAMPAIFV